MHHHDLAARFQCFYLRLQTANVGRVHFEQLEFVLFTQQMLGDERRARVVDQPALRIEMVQHPAIVQQ